MMWEAKSEGTKEEPKLALRGPENGSKLERRWRGGRTKIKPMVSELRRES